MSNQNGQKSLSEVFRELERNKDKQVQIYDEQRRKKQEASFIYHVKQRTKKDNIILTLIVLIVLFTFSLFSKNYIFAVNANDSPKNAIGLFEKNDNPKDVYEILSNNISNIEQKEIIDQEQEIAFETQRIYNKDMPDEEVNMIQEGIIGKKIVTYVRTYENNEMLEQVSIGESILQEPQTEILEIGTSKVLKEYNIHIEDNLYTSEDVALKEEADTDSENLLTVPKYYDVKVLEVMDEAWLKVAYQDEKVGYILTDYLTSEALTPGIAELSRTTKILSKVDFNMELNQPSGLLLEDYEKIFSNQAQDTNHVFKENYKAFYDAEQKYEINGIFLAAIAIHESGWGKSTISTNNYNLFGFGAYDSSPAESARTFNSYAEGIDIVAAWLANNYLNPIGTTLKTGDIANGRYYNGANVTGVNVKYASDSDWSTKVFDTMKKLYSEI